MRRKFKGDGYAVATLLYGPPKVDPDGQTSLPLDNPEPPEEEPQVGNPEDQPLSLLSLRDSYEK